jgi:molecular chaperone GrpE
VAAQHDPAFPADDDQRRPAAGADTQDAAPPAEEAAPDAAAAIANLQARIGVLENEWRRALADADNVRKRSARDAERIRARERAEAARQWLPVIDDLDRALDHAQADPGSIVGGVRAVRDEALRVLAGRSS